MQHRIRAYYKESGEVLEAPRTLGGILTMIICIARGLYYKQGLPNDIWVVSFVGRGPYNPGPGPGPDTD